ncbi:MAG: bifunctional (p)ppGpp synthetase/guanosine-3',5'-bis(diphosphate) 3'-pyrophosphohydrolase, partial [Bdellovibrionales bacterium]|nr:bifunctional (p)ppGpp synthetase/guanosine-3',5'-bis(diphosphate) 3'-pyrophosphohydrolase [Bdellovibrionales bacterium]
VVEKLQRKDSPLERIFQKAAKASRQKVGVQVSGHDDILIRFARCCEPLPGDRIVGFISRGRGVTVHLANCAQVMKSDPLRRVDVFWDSDLKNPRRVRITVHCQDAMGLLANVTSAITTNRGNIANAQVKTTDVGKAVFAFELLVEDARQLESIIRAIEMVPGVRRVERVKHITTLVQMSEESDILPDDKVTSEIEDL